MSGLGGHIDHIYDNLELTFGEVKTMVKGLCNGEITATEKLDGYNLYMTVCKDGFVYIARSQKDIKNGGIDLETAAKIEFAGGPKAKKAFVEAAQVLENAFLNESPEDIIEIFSNGEIYYNFEIITKEKQNLIQYDKNMIILLPVGHAKFDKITGKPIKEEDVSENYSIFVEKIFDLNVISDTLPYEFSTSEEISIESPDIYEEFVKKLDFLMKPLSLKDTHKIKDFYKTSIIKTLTQMKAFDIQNHDIFDTIADILVGNKTTRDIPKNLSESEKSFIANFSKTSKNGKKLLHVSKWPLEIAFHNMSVELINGLDTDSDDELKDTFKKDLEKAVKAIKGYEGEDSDVIKDVLNKNMAKIGSFDKLNSNLEGIVFNFKDNLYKLTGNFAPANQIINIFKHGRGKMPSLDTTLEEGLPAEVQMQSQLAPDPAGDVSAEDASIALFPGSFKPPHAGHYDAVRKLLEMKNPYGEFMVKTVRILISPKPRYSDDHKIFIDADASLEMWKKFGINEQRIQYEICEKSPVQSVFDMIKINEYGDENFMVVTSEKDKDDGRFKKLSDYNPEVEIKYCITPAYHNMNASRVRNAISANDFETFKDYMPVHLDMKEIRSMWSTLKNATYNKMYQKFQDESATNPVYGELKKRYPNLSEDRKFVSEMVLRESVKKIKGQ